MRQQQHIRTLGPTLCQKLRLASVSPRYLEVLRPAVDAGRVLAGQRRHQFHMGPVARLGKTHATLGRLLDGVSRLSSLGHACLEKGRDGYG